MWRRVFRPSFSRRVFRPDATPFSAVRWQNRSGVTRFLVRRLLLTIPVLVGVATLVFSLIHLVPGDPVQAMLGESASPQDVAQLRTRLGLDRPLYEQYALSLIHI